MCGIGGTYAPGGPPADEGVLLSMAGELLHRGPDAVGVYLDGDLGMVSTRLSIIDLQGGDQPISNETGRYWVVQNGEVYNHVELRRTLESHGHAFRTTSDTEVLVHAFEEWGEGCLEHLNGDFAFALWDALARTLFLARDRLGVRPLFVHEDGRSIRFASEVKALLGHPEVERALDPVGIIDLFTLWSILPDRSAFQSVRELAPGHYLRYGPEGLIEERRWWDLRWEPMEPGATPCDAELDEALRCLLHDATRLRLRSDVPVGIYLSGGLDSSVIAAAAARQEASVAGAYGVGFELSSFDEGRYQELAADAFDLDLQRVRIGAQQIAEAFPQVVAHAEVPVLRTAAAPMLYLSRLVRRSGARVVLCGEGADEMFAGYDIFKEARIRRFCADLPDSELRPMLLRRIYPYLQPTDGSASALQKQFFRRWAGDAAEPLYSHQVRFANGIRNLRFMRPEALDRSREQGDPIQRLRARLPVGFEDMSPLGRAQYIEATTFLQGYLLHAQGDRMLMANAVEGRFPYLDHRVVEFAAALPDRLKLRGLDEKVILRRSMASQLPPDLVNRRKRPYRAPLTNVFVGPNEPDYVTELLDVERVSAVGIFEPSQVTKLLAKVRRHGVRGVNQNDEMAFMGILSTMLLHDRLVANPSPAPRARPSRTVRAADADAIARV